MLRMRHASIYLMFGDTQHELALNPTVPSALRFAIELADLVFRKDCDYCSYISNEIDLTYLSTDKNNKIYSSVGDVSYFYKRRVFIITFCDEERTLGEPRIVIGKLTRNSSFYQLASLLQTETAKIRFNFFFQ